MLMYHFPVLFKTYGVEYICALKYFTFQNPASYSCHATKQTHHAKYKIVIKNDKISNLKKTWTNTTLFEYVQAKSDIRQFPNYFLTIFDFTLPFFKDLSQDG